MNTAGKSYSIEDHEGYSIMLLPQELDYNHCKLFEDEIDRLSVKYHLIVNCENLADIPKDWLRALLRLHINLKRENKFMKLIHVSPVLMSCLKREGLEGSFKIAKDLRDALHETGLTPKRTLDTEFINPFLMATTHVLKVQAQIDAKGGRIHLKKPGDKSQGDISGVIGIVSDKFNGSVVITFPESTFLRVISNMLGEEFTKIDNDIIDGAGELTNMIFGQAKIVLNEKGYGIKTAIPNIVSGKNHSLASLTKGPVIVIPFESTAGNFFVQICLSN